MRTTAEHLAELKQAQAECRAEGDLLGANTHAEWIHHIESGHYNPGYVGADRTPLEFWLSELTVTDEFGYWEESPRGLDDTSG